MLSADKVTSNIAFLFFAVLIVGLLTVRRIQLVYPSSFKSVLNCEVFDINICCFIKLAI